LEKGSKLCRKAILIPCLPYYLEVFTIVKRKLKLWSSPPYNATFLTLFKKDCKKKLLKRYLIRNDLD
jgi:hypothetical protein